MRHRLDLNLNFIDISFFYFHRILIAETTSESSSRSVTVAGYTFAAQTPTIQRTTWSTWVYLRAAVLTIIYYALSHYNFVFLSFFTRSPIWHIFQDTSTCLAWVWVQPNVRTTRWTTRRPFGQKKAIRDNCRLCTVVPTPSSPKRTQLSSGRTCTTWPRVARNSRSRGRSNTTPTGSTVSV